MQTKNHQTTYVRRARSLYKSYTVARTGVCGFILWYWTRSQRAAAAKHTLAGLVIASVAVLCCPSLPGIDSGLVVVKVNYGKTNQTMSNWQFYRCVPARTNGRMITNTLSFHCLPAASWCGWGSSSCGLSLSVSVSSFFMGNRTPITLGGGVGGGSAGSRLISMSATNHMPCMFIVHKLLTDTTWHTWTSFEYWAKLRIQKAMAKVRVGVHNRQHFICNTHQDALHQTSVFFCHQPLCSGWFKSSKHKSCDKIALRLTARRKAAVSLWTNLLHYFPCKRALFQWKFHI